MKLGTREDLEGVIHVFVKNLKNSKMALSQYQIFLMELVAEIYKLGRNYEIDMGQIFPPKTNLYENLYQLDSPEAVGGWMLDICMKVRLPSAGSGQIPPRPSWNGPSSTCRTTIRKATCRWRVSARH